MRFRFALFLTPFLLFFTAFSPSSQANEACPTVDLEDPGQSAAQIEVWNQGKSNYCYVYSASLLATAWMRQMWSAEDSSYLNSTSLPEENVKKILADPIASVQTLDANTGRTCESVDFILANSRSTARESDQSRLPLPQCKSWGINLSTDHLHKVQVDPSAFESKMHELLTSSSHPLPFGIEYCSGVFFDPKAELIVNRVYQPDLSYLNEDSEAAKGNFKNEPKQTSCGFHAAVVIGQEFRNGACFFKIRNSKGKALINPRHPFEHNPDFDHGDYWIPADALSRNVLRLEIISP